MAGRRDHRRLLAIAFPLDPPIAPMLAKLRPEIPRGQGWLYEPKWDGFRAIVFRDGEKSFIASRNGRRLDRYFPELAPLFTGALPTRCVVDGEIVVAGDAGLDFEALQLRIHPAESRVKQLAEEIPSSFIAFDLLALDHDLRQAPFGDRRRSLETSVVTSSRCFLTPQSADPVEADSWFEEFEGAGLDGIIAKRVDLKYIPGERVMVKVKHSRTADCVVVGYRVSKDGAGIGSLLLGVYEDGTLHWVGHTSSFSAKQRRELLHTMKSITLEEGPEMGRVPTPSRWTGDRELEWHSVEPRMVCEVAFDHLQGYRFRHGTRFLRWRTDKDPHECNWDQFVPPNPFSLDEIRALSERSGED